MLITYFCSRGGCLLDQGTIFLVLLLWGSHLPLTGIFPPKCHLRVRFVIMLLPDLWEKLKNSLLKCILVLFYLTSLCICGGSVLC